jgi:hypothetical protein
MTSSVSVMSSPSLRSRGLPQHRQAVGPGSTTRSRGRCLGKGWLAGEGHDIRGLGDGLLGGDLVLGRRTLELLEGQRHLIDIAALQAELIAERERAARVEAELAVAKAEASDDQALIAARRS